MKRCSRCGETKPPSEFRKNRSKWDGLTTYCTLCERERERSKKRVRKQDPVRRAEDSKRYAKRHPDKIHERRLKQAKAHPEKTRARRTLAYAVQRKRVLKPDICERCKEKIELARDIHGHHHDYSKPLDVEWLCRTCHMAEHGAEKRL